MSCNSSNALNVCPTQEQVYEQALSLFPVGLAWQTDTASRPRSKSVYKRLVYAMSSAFTYVEQRICAGIEQFWCVSASETLPEWEAEFGWPDRCHAFANVCDMLAASFDGRCAALKDYAAKFGYLIDCYQGECEVPLPKESICDVEPFRVAFAPLDPTTCCDGTPPPDTCRDPWGAQPPCITTDSRCTPHPFQNGGMGCMTLGEPIGPFCPPLPGQIMIIVDPDSPALLGAGGGLGCTPIGCEPLCPPTLEPLLCILEMVVPAHMQIMPSFKPTPCPL